MDAGDLVGADERGQNNITADDEEEEEDVGPALPPVAGEQKRGRKKRRRLEFENVLVAQLPSSDMYERSFMHREVVTHIKVTRHTDFVITASADGILKFWKKIPATVEFVKQFKAHTGPISSMAVSVDGKWLATTSKSDSTAKIFDVAAFDMVSVLRMNYKPAACEWVHRSGAASTALVVSDADSSQLHVYHPGRPNEPARCVEIHSASVTLISYNARYDYVVSVDTDNMIEYWRPQTDGRPFPADLSFEYKSETDLYEFAKCQTVPTSLEMSPDGTMFACFAEDRQVRIFDFLSGKTKRKYDESLGQLQRNQNTGTIRGLPNDQKRLDPGDFGRKLVTEKELSEKETSNILFDSSSSFILYATPIGIKVVNIVTNQLTKLIGTSESAERFVYLALYQGSPVESVGASVQARKKEVPDPTLITTSFEKHRFYLFTNRDPEDDKDGVGRDVFNEKPSRVISAPENRSAGLLRSSDGLSSMVTLHTTLGDIVLHLFPDMCPKTVENFTGHCRSGYYNLVKFHRVIRNFMIQTGDPRGDGTGGTSIWEEEFEDEFVPSLKHDKEGTLSMANSGPNTNGSQFFIATVPCPWLDGKHTVFGRVIKGMDVVKAIEMLKVDKKDRPLNDVKIASVTVS